MTFPSSVISVTGAIVVTTWVSLPLQARPYLDPHSTESAAEQSSQSLGGPIGPSTNPFRIETKGSRMHRVSEAPSAQRFIIQSQDDLTIEVSRFDQNTSAPPAPYFDDQRDKHSGLRFFRLKAD